MYDESDGTSKIYISDLAEEAGLKYSEWDYREI